MAFARGFAACRDRGLRLADRGGGVPGMRGDQWTTRPLGDRHREGEALAGRYLLEPTDLTTLHLEVGDGLGEVVMEGEGEITGGRGQGGGDEDEGC